MPQRIASDRVGSMRDDDCELPVLIALTDMPDLFGVTQQSCWRWNTQAVGEGSRLPAPDGRLSGTPYWFESTVREWAASRRSRLTVDETVMEQIRSRQFGGV